MIFSKSRLLKFNNRLRLKLTLSVMAILLITELMIFVSLGLFMVNHDGNYVVF
jgi:hypothetical protein